MKFRLTTALLLLAIPAAAQAMPVSAFLAKAEALQKKGALAMFSGDLKLLMNQVKADAGSVRAERLAAKAAGRTPPFCPPEKGASLSDKDVLAAMRAVPPAQRTSTSTRDALKASLVRRYPCRG